MSVFYNEIDTYCCDWLSNLMDAGLIPPGKIDERPIQEISSGDVRGFTQCHFFAGLGGWAYALRQAGWPGERPVWTGSPPCQGFSVAGKQLGFADPRHLWPFYKPLIEECRPTTVFGEQVAAASAWLDLVRSDLEAMDYAVGAIPIQAASAGADHFRDRYWFVAHRDGNGGRGEGYPKTSGEAPALQGKAWQQRIWSDAGSDGADGGSPLAHRDGVGSQVTVGQPGDVGSEREAVAGDSVRDVVNDPSVGWGEGWTESEFRRWGFTAAVASIDGGQYVECPDGKWRRLPPPRVRWLGHGVPARIPKLRAIGNAIDPRPATAFIRAFMESEQC